MTTIGLTPLLPFLVPLLVIGVGLWMIWRGVKGIRHAHRPLSDTLGRVEPQPEGETGGCGGPGAGRERDSR